jgi:lipoprotein-anchoring transpeptidase ErfK/SrfK
VSVSQELAQVLFRHRAHSSPRTSSRQVAWVQSRRPITAERTTLPVLRRFRAAGGRRWLKVRLPGRPNGSSGWIRRAGTRQLETRWHIVASTADRRLEIFSRGRLVRRFRAVVGAPSTPTPTGRFFVEETVRMPSDVAGGPYALALSARSNVLQEFAGGPGQIAIHGRDLIGGVLGTAASHGCMRLDTGSISWLAARIGPGVPVTIR